MARVLIVGGGCRGRLLTASLLADGHVVRATTRTERGRAAIEALGAECWVGDPDRLATLRGALDGVSVLCWLLATASGTRDALRALHGDRLRFFLTQAIDTTVRGVVYEMGGTGARTQELRGSEQVARDVLERNAIPAAFLAADPADGGEWLASAREAVGSLLMRGA